MLGTPWRSRHRPTQTAPHRFVSSQDGAGGPVVRLGPPATPPAAMPTAGPGGRGEPGAAASFLFASRLRGEKRLERLRPNARSARALRALGLDAAVTEDRPHPPAELEPSPP